MPIQTTISRRGLLRLGLMQSALFALVVGGCGGGGGGSKGASSGNGEVTGIVRDSANEDLPLENVTVAIGGVSGQTRTVANANSDTGDVVGSFRLSGVPTGSGSAVVTLADGSQQTIAFLPKVANGANSPLELFVNIGQITGRVLLPDGQPATLAQLIITATGETISAESDGTFLLNLVPRGATTVFAVQGTASKTFDVQVGNGETAVGNVQLVDDPNPNPPDGPYTLIGKVTLDNGAAQPGTTVFLFRDGIQRETATTGSDGQYRFYVPVGNYTVRATRAGFADVNSGIIVLSDPNTPIRADLNMTSL